MIVKYSDKFESILNAVMYSNLANVFLMPRNVSAQSATLFDAEEYIDIDNLNTAELFTRHNSKYGELKWLKEKNIRFKQFKDDVNLVLRHYNPYKYQVLQLLFKYIIKYGLKYLNNNNDVMVVKFNQYLKEVKVELKNAVLGQSQIFPLKIKGEKFLVAYYNCENNISELIYNKLSDKYRGYSLVLKNKNTVYFTRDKKVWSLDWREANEEKSSFEKFWEAFYLKLKINLNTDDGLLRNPFSWIKGVSLAAG